MIKLRPIVNNILKEDDGNDVTWGNVRRFLEALQKESKTKNWGKIIGFAKNVLRTTIEQGTIEAILKIKGGLTAGPAGVADAVEGAIDLGKSLMALSKMVSEAQLENPLNSQASKFKGELWDKLKLSSKVSAVLDNNIEKEFINSVLEPMISNPGNDNEPIPNIDELLGKWLNDTKGLATDADIQFKGKQGDL
jgi:hypothetical protein